MRGELGVAEARQRAHGAEQDEGEDERGAGAVAGHGAVRRDLAHGGRADARRRCRPR